VLPETKRTCLDVSSAEWVVREVAIGFGRLLDEAFALLRLPALRD
jgi:hypothetical protein